MSAGVASPAGEVVVRGEAVVKRWGATTALDEASFSVPSGITGLLGSNGAGKTTLLGLFLGLHQASSGRLEVLGLDPAQAGPLVRQRIGYSPEHHLLPPDLRAHDFVGHIAEVHGLPRREARARASDALYLVGLGEERFRPIGTMSTGQRQRVKLAQALAHDPMLLLLDEPTDGLDPVQRDEMLELIRRIGTVFGIDIVLSSHLLDEVERVCDYAVILQEGSVIASGRIDDLLGGDRGLVIEIDGDPSQLAAALRARDIEITVDGRTVRIDEADENVHLATRDALVATGAPLRRLHTGHRSLEELFLQLGGAD